MNNDKTQGSIQEAQVEMARTRTVLALDRTLLAWVRTALSLIAFGFTLGRFVHDLIVAGTLHGIEAQYPRMLGVTLMVLGILALLAGAFDHWRSVKRLNVAVTMSVWSASLIVAIIIAIMGTLLMINLVTDLSPQ